MKCRVDNCIRAHNDDQAFCRSHWFALPKRVRDEIWLLLRTMPGSEQHRRAIFDALDFLNIREATRRREFIERAN